MKDVGPSMPAPASRYLLIDGEAAVMEHVGKGTYIHTCVPSACATQAWFSRGWVTRQEAAHTPAAALGHRLH